MSPEPVPGERTLELAEVAAAIEASWSIDTCDDTDRERWSQEHPSTGQCTASAFVLQDLLGGELLEAKVTGADGEPRGHHHWNRLPDGTEVDLTLSQFDRGEVVGRPIVLERYGPPNPGQRQYAVLSERVRAALRI